MRINQFVARATNQSRRAADELIAAGRVRVNDVPVGPGYVTTSPDAVTLDGRVVTLPDTYVYALFHKPVGYVSSRTQQGADPTIYQLLPKNLSRLRPVGRLDRDSSGLLLLSDDGDFIHTFTHPSFEKTKVYDVVLDRPLHPDDVTALTRGVKLTDGISRLGIKRHHGPRATVTLHEGRNRQIRRTFGALGYGVRQLHRTQVGPYKLRRLAPGEYKLTHKAAV